MAKMKIRLSFCLAIFFYLFNKVSGELCKPCEENKQCKISHEYIGNSTNTLYWKIDDNDVVICDTSRVDYCYIFPEYNKYVSSSKRSEPGRLSVDLIFLNTSRHSSSLSIERNWMLFVLIKTQWQLIFSCDVKIFRKPTAVYCNYRAQRQGLQIQCVSEMSYPNMACTFMVQATQNVKPQYLLSESNHTTVRYDPVYYKSTCLAIIPCELFINSLIKFEVRFFPKVVQGYEHCECGMNYSNSLKIEYLNTNLKLYALTNKEGTIINVYCQQDELSTVTSANNFETKEGITKQPVLIVIVIAVAGLLCVVIYFVYKTRGFCCRRIGQIPATKRRRSNELYPGSLEKLIKENDFGKYFPVHLGSSKRRHNFSGFTSINNSIRKSNSIEMEHILESENTINDGILERSVIMREDNMCYKNNKHPTFINVNDFTIKDLPDKYQDKRVFDYIKVISELTGRVDVYFTSPERPDVDPITKAKYPGWDTKKTKNMRTGTGTVVSVIDVRDGECPCLECEESPSKVFYLVYVLTAKHVVFDDNEARHSYFRIDYDTETSPLHRLYGKRIVESDMNAGGSLVEYVTHESNFGIPLSGKVAKLDNTEKKIPKYFHSLDNNLAVIVSHPHGEPKHVTIGEWVERDLKSTQTGKKARYFYTTDTCQGSSGAAVIVLGDILPRVVKRLKPSYTPRTSNY